MVNNAARTSLLFGGWIAMLSALAAACIATSAAPSTTLLLVAIGVTPGVVMALLKRGEPSPTVAEILHPVHAHGRRS
jgi:hypothetical protein